MANLIRIISVLALLAGGATILLPLITDLQQAATQHGAR